VENIGEVRNGYGVGMDVTSSQVASKNAKDQTGPDFEKIMMCPI